MQLSRIHALLSQELISLNLWKNFSLVQLSQFMKKYCGFFITYTTHRMRIWVVIFSALLLTACASKKESPMSNEPVVRALFTQLNEWKGTPYRYGGNTKSGIDCSAFVQITYTTLFNKNLPRSTTEQAQLGTKIKPKEHRPGDLIFFRTEGSKQINHVGIYAENNTFIHASTSKGVTRSSLNNPYWQKNYVYSRRVTNLASFM